MRPWPHRPFPRLPLTPTPRCLCPRPKSLAEYREAAPQGYYELGKLNPDLNSDELVHKVRAATRRRRRTGQPAGAGSPLLYCYRIALAAARGQGQGAGVQQQAARDQRAGGTAQRRAAAAAEQGDGAGVESAGQRAGQGGVALRIGRNP